MSTSVAYQRADLRQPQCITDPVPRSTVVCLSTKLNVPCMQVLPPQLAVPQPGTGVTAAVTPELPGASALQTPYREASGSRQMMTRHESRAPGVALSKGDSEQQARPSHDSFSACLTATQRLRPVRRSASRKLIFGADHSDAEAQPSRDNRRRKQHNPW